MTGIAAALGEAQRWRVWHHRATHSRYFASRAAAQTWCDRWWRRGTVIELTDEWTGEIWERRDGTWRQYRPPQRAVDAAGAVDAVPADTPEQWWMR